MFIFNVPPGGLEELPEGHSLASLGIRGGGSRHPEIRNRKTPKRVFLFLMPPGGLEPPAFSLKGCYSTIELWGPYTKFIK